MRSQSAGPHAKNHANQPAGPHAKNHASQRAVHRASIEQHSKSFALASRLLPPKVNHDAAVLYAYCRRADDAIDLSPPNQQMTQLRALRAELAG
ncbi:MAG TPA: squalene/phytoene synthase family protein, partial [Polyangiales bacterium]|nr:squalene/phytoene synthase family protein [Polyangiales bacterium]